MSWMDLLSVWTNRQLLSPTTQMRSQNMQFCRAQKWPVLGDSNHTGLSPQAHCLWPHDDNCSVSKDVNANTCIHNFYETHTVHTTRVAFTRWIRMLSAWCLPVDPFVGVCEVLLRDVPRRQWDWMPERERDKSREIHGDQSDLQHV